MLLLVVFIGSGCGVKLAYNNGDRLVRWWVDDYIDMTRVQRGYLRDATNELLYWHRTTELAGYRQVFLALADDMYQPESAVQPTLSPEQLQALIDHVETWGMRIGDRAVPIAVQMMLSLDLEQRVEFSANVEEGNLEYLEEAQQDPVERVKEMARDYNKFLRRMVGRLEPEQRELILERHGNLVVFEEQTVIFRRAWLRQVEMLLAAEPPDRDKLAELLWLDEEDYPAEFQAVFRKNEQVYQQLTLDLFNSLTLKQRKRFAERLRTLARIFQELIDETGAAPDAPVPLVGLHLHNATV